MYQCSGSASGSVRCVCFWASRMMAGSEDPDPYQNVTDPSGERYTVPASREKYPCPIIKIITRLAKSKVLHIKETLKIIFLIFLINVNLWTVTYREWTGPTCASHLLLLGDPLPAAASHAFSPPSRPRDQRSRVLLRADSLWALGHAKIKTGASSGLHASLTSGQS